MAKKEKKPDYKAHLFSFKYILFDLVKWLGFWQFLLWWRPKVIYDDKETKWIVIPCNENGDVPSGVNIPSREEIYAQIAFQEQFYNGVLVGM